LLAVFTKLASDSILIQLHAVPIRCFLLFTNILLLTCMPSKYPLSFRFSYKTLRLFFFFTFVLQGPHNPSSNLGWFSTGAQYRIITSSFGNILLLVLPCFFHCTADSYSSFGGKTRFVCVMYEFKRD